MNDDQSVQQSLIRLIEHARMSCMKLMNETLYTNEELYCNRTWDKILCWPDTKAGVTAFLHCPSYIYGFDEKEYATRHCGMNGTWTHSLDSNVGWSNYSACHSKHPYPLLSIHLPYIQKMSSINYNISLAALILALFLMLLCRLRSKSNTLHMNLFAAFILRSCISLLKEKLFVHGIGFSSDINYTDDGQIRFTNASHWQCKFLFSTFQYSISLTHTWIFVEGLYLHTLVYKTLWVERNGIKLFVLLGWVTPIFIMIPWVILRSTTENTMCWSNGESAQLYWSLRAPVVITVIVNFGFFLNILRMLVLRARASHRQMNSQYRKTAKFILTLIPLFGIVYLLFIAVPHTEFDNKTLELIYLYTEMFCNSIQGFVLSLLFCFLNEEVHTELHRMCNRYRSRFSWHNLFRKSHQSPSTRIPLKTKESTNRWIDTSTGCTYPDNDTSMSGRDTRSVIKLHEDVSFKQIINGISSENKPTSL